MDRKKKILIVVIAVFVLTSATVASFSPLIYEGGWEVKNNIYKIGVAEKTYTEDLRPLHTYSWGTAYCKFDVDSETSGVPTLTVSTTGVDEYVSEEGEWVKAREGEYYKVLDPVIVGEDTYFFYHHVFFFEIRVIAEADWTNVATDGEAKQMGGALKAPVSVFMLFDSSLWNVLSSIEGEAGEATYINSGVWTGVMSASVLEASGGYVSPLPIGFAGIEGSWSVSNVDRLNMFLPDGSPAGDSDLDTLSSAPAPAEIQGVPTQVVMEIAGTTLQPGWWWPPLGSVGTYAVKADYRIRVDVVTSAKYTFHTGDQNDQLGNVSIEDRAAEGILGQIAAFFNSLGSIFTGGLLTLGIIAVGIVVIIVAIRRRSQ